jgi:cell division protein ZapD
MDQIAEPKQVAQNSAMTGPATEPQSLSSTAGRMESEQPLTERMRTFLRIELLNRQACFHSEDATEVGTRAAISSLLEILTILSRADVRADVLKELERQGKILVSFARRPGVDPARLQGFVDELHALQEDLSNCSPKFIAPLKECDFLNNIKHRSSIPGGTCMFDLPDYAYWLRLPYEERLKQFQAWLEIIRPICDAVIQVLWLIREANEPDEQLAVQGMYQHNMEGGAEPNLVRVLLPADEGIYPEISAGKHRFTVRFVKWQGTEKRPAQVEQDVRFLLALC